ncbi:MAG: hypothetical protein PUK40_01160 [Actinomycetaceae bacterium]|nr:hypothetical protein [Arcanobacterium sp.]MDD7504550.1 hypothetical protein [Actinomycetaceae bacterium]MDY6143193.1 hypothetical protein [Arcanobacterium sp.]
MSCDATVVSPRLLADDPNFDRNAFYREVRQGKWTRIGRGVYVLNGNAAGSAADLALLEAVVKRPEATICLLSALDYYGLTDEIPRGKDLAIPTGVRAPKTFPGIAWHHFDRDTFGYERDTIAIAGSSERIGIYTAERTIVDCFRLRAQVGYELALSALKTWLDDGGKPAALLQVARSLPRSFGFIQRTLEVLL